MNGREAAVFALAERLGHPFADPSLLERALTHRSVGQGARAVADNERLEFLGDRVLNLVVAARLMTLYPEEQEGDLSRRLHVLVSGRTCAAVARGWGVGPALRLPGGESKRGARDHDTFLADACEALIAAVYLDGGLGAAEALVERGWGEALAGGLPALAPSPKTALQEWSLARSGALPRYELVRRSGPDHSPHVVVSVAVAGLAPCEGEGGSRKEAEKAAAQALLRREGVSG